MAHANICKIGAAGCAALLIGGIGAFALSGQLALGSETATEDAANPYASVEIKTYGDEATAQALIASGATFGDLKAAGIEVLLDEGGKLMFDPHNAHYDYKCADCHRGASESDATESTTESATESATEATEAEAAEATAAETVAPVLMCNTCHRLTLPEGWENPEYNQSSKPKFVDPLTIYGDLGYGTSGVSYGIPYSNAAK